MDFDLFYTDENASFSDAIARKLERTFGVKVQDAGLLRIPDDAWNPRRSQYDAYALLDYLARHMKSVTALWAVGQDITCANVNFVFGLAMYHKAAVVSTFRLATPVMVVKEAVHEAGHVMGLQHCKNRCVMRFSNTYEDALRKPDTLCDTCRRTIARRMAPPGLKM